MIKKITFVTILFLVASVFSVMAVDKEQEGLYLKAIAEKDLNMKIGFLKEYAEKYSQKDDKFLRYVFQSLADTSYRLKNFDEAIKYGEIAVANQELDQTNRLYLLFSLANSYYVTKKDLGKAFENAGKVIEICSNFIMEMEKSDQDKSKVEQMVKTYRTYYIAPAYKLQALVLYAKDKDNIENIKQSAANALKAYDIDNAEAYSSLVFSLAGNLSQKSQYNDAVALLEKIIDKEKPKYNEANVLGALYYKLKDKEKAIHYYELAYKSKPQADLAMKIGQLVNKDDPDKGARYFADAYIFSNLDKQSDAFKYLQHVYFNVLAKGKSEEEKEAGFQELINAAKTRVGAENNN